MHSKSNQVKKKMKQNALTVFFHSLFRIRFSLAQEFLSALSSCSLQPQVLSEGNELQEQAKFSLSRPGCAVGVFPEFFFYLLVLPNAALLSHHLGCFLLPPAELGSQTCVIVGCSSSPMSSVRTGTVSPSGAPVPGIGQATGLH